MTDSRRTLVWWIAGMVIVLVVFGNQGFRQLAGKILEKRRLERTLTNLRNDRVRLEQELNWIQHDPAYTEFLIRKNLGYVKKGEVEYRFLKKGKAAGATKNL